MASAEPYDFLTAANGYTDPAVPDYSATTLSLKAQGIVTEESYENTEIHEGDDSSEERICLSSSPIFFISFDYNALSESDSGLLLDFYHTNANGMTKSFQFIHDGHTYVVRFDCKLQRVGQSHNFYAAPGIRFKILGRIADV